MPGSVSIVDGDFLLVNMVKLLKIIKYKCDWLEREREFNENMNGFYVECMMSSKIGWKVT